MYLFGAKYVSTRGAITKYNFLAVPKSVNIAALIERDKCGCKHYQIHSVGDNCCDESLRLQPKYYSNLCTKGLEGQEITG